MRAASLAIVLAAVLSAWALVPAARATGPTLQLSPTQGPPGTPVTVSGGGFSAGASVTLLWFTMEGSRVGGSGFVETNSSLGTVVADGSGAFTFAFTTPYDLGGPPHRIAAVVGGVDVAEASYTLTRHMWIEPTSGPEGTSIGIRLVGGGWTQYDNNVAITYDNAFLGFACSFNSQGNISVWVQATGGPGAHVIGVYPALYYGPSDGPTPWKHPMLNPADLPERFDPQEFVFTVTGGAQRSFLVGTDLHVTTAPDSLAVPSLPATPVEDGTPELSLGNGAKGIVGGDLPYALAGFPANAAVDLRWDTVTGATKISGDKNLGWVFAPSVIDLGTVTVNAAGDASGTFSLPSDFGGDHTIEAVVAGQTLATATWKLVPAFSADLSADGTRLDVHGTGLGWEKYTATWDILYDNRLMGVLSAFTSSGAVDVSLPVVGAPGLHAIDIHEGSNGWPYLNMHESPWPWEPVYRFAFTIPEPAPAQSAGPTMSAWLLPPAIVLAAIAGFAVAAVRRRRSASKASEGAD